METFYSSAEIDEDLKCSYCRQQFVEVVKLVPDCGEFICGHCYETVMSQLADSREFACRACEATHLMPHEGLANCRGLSRMLKRRKIERLLSDEAKELKVQMEAVQGQLLVAKTFDAAHHVSGYCDQLMFQVSRAVESTIRQLREIEEDLLREIKKYRQRCHAELSGPASEAQARAGEELEALAREMDAAGQQWTGVELALASDSAVEAALGQIKTYETRLAAVQEKLKASAFSGQLMLFEAESGLGDLLRNRLRLFFQETKTQALRIQETPSLTLAGHPEPVNQVLFLADGTLASCSKDKSIKIWNIQDGKEIRQLKIHHKSVNALALLPNGRLVSGSRDATIKICDLEQRKVVRTLAGHTLSVVSLLTLKNGNLASYSCDDTIRIWNPYSNKNNLLMTMKGHGNTDWPIRFGCLSNDDLVTCTRDRDNKEESVMRVWSRADGQIIQEVRTGLSSFRSILVLANDQVALGFDNGTIKVVDLADETRSQTKERAHQTLVTAIVQFSNGNLVSAGFDARLTLKVWSFPDFQLLQLIAVGHSDTIWSLAVSPDEKLLATASRDKTIKLWPIVAS